MAITLHCGTTKDGGEGDSSCKGRGGKREEEKRGRERSLTSPRAVTASTDFASVCSLAPRSYAGTVILVPGRKKGEIRKSRPRRKREGEKGEKKKRGPDRHHQ